MAVRTFASGIRGVASLRARSARGRRRRGAARAGAERGGVGGSGNTDGTAIASRGHGRRLRMVRGVRGVRASDRGGRDGGRRGRGSPRPGSRRRRPCSVLGAVRGGVRDRRRLRLLDASRDAHGTGAVAFSSGSSRSGERALVDDLPLPPDRRCPGPRGPIDGRRAVRLRSRGADRVPRVRLRRDPVRPRRRMDSHDVREPDRRPSAFSPDASRGRSRPLQSRVGATGVGSPVRHRVVFGEKSFGEKPFGKASFEARQRRIASPIASDATLATQLAASAPRAPARPPRHTRAASR